MIMRLAIYSILLGTLLTGCTAANQVLSDRTGPTPTATDMLNILDDTEPSRPFSYYIYKVKAKDGTRESSGGISMSPAAEQDVRLVTAGSKLKVVTSRSFVSANDLQAGNAEEVPFGGGYAAAGRLAIVPGLYTPVEFQPQWFPTNAAVSVDNRCNFLIKMNDAKGNETQKLVAFIDARTKFDRAHCEVLGTFTTIPQLKKLVTDLRRQGRYDGKLHYVLRLNWTDTFALIRILRDGER